MWSPQSRLYPALQHIHLRGVPQWQHWVGCEPESPGFKCPGTPTCRSKPEEQDQCRSAWALVVHLKKRHFLTTSQKHLLLFSS